MLYIVSKTRKGTMEDGLKKIKKEYGAKAALDKVIGMNLSVTVLSELIENERSNNRTKK